MRDNVFISVATSAPLWQRLDFAKIGGFFIAVPDEALFLVR